MPSLTPVTVGCVGGAVWPAAMITLAGDMVSVLGSLLDNATVTFAGAACGSVTGNVAVLPSPTVVLEGSPMAPAVTTVILAVAFGMFGAAVLAVMVAEPKPTAVTSTFALVAPAVILTLGGTVATLGVPELRVNVKPPAGAAPERLSTRFCVANPVMVALDGVKLMVAFTCTGALADV